MKHCLLLLTVALLLNFSSQAMEKEASSSHAPVTFVIKNHQDTKRIIAQRVPSGKEVGILYPHQSTASFSLEPDQAVIIASDEGLYSLMMLPSGIGLTRLDWQSTRKNKKVTQIGLLPLETSGSTVAVTFSNNGKVELGYNE